MTQLIDLGKLRFHFAGDWASGTQYESNDIVKYGGNVYVYTYALKSAGVLPTDASRWALMIEGFNFQGVYSTSTNYKIGDTVAHGGIVYVSVLDSYNITPPNATYWSKFSDGIQYEGEFSSVASYQKNDVVKYGGSIYIAKQDTTTNLPTNTTFWDKFVEGVSPEGVYNSSVNYVPNDLVAYGANIYRAKIETINNAPSNTTYWELYVGGIKFLGAYSAVTEYYVNDLVSYGNIIYRARQTTTANLPTNDTYWELLVGGTAFEGVYNNATTYYNGDLVNYGGNVYIALGLTVGNLPTNTANWSPYVSGFSYRGAWSSSTAYYINEAVTYGGSLYSAISTNTNINPTVTATWSKLAAGIKSRGPWATSTEYATEEVVTYGGNTFISLLPHASNNFNTDLAAAKWEKFNSGIRWRGIWDSATQYYKDDIIKAGSSSFIANYDVIGGANPASGVLAAWANLATGAEGFLSKDGDAMLGMLTLFAAPTDPLHAATKGYTDLFINASAGGTISGPLVASGAAATYSATGGATININAGSLNLTNGTTLTTDGTSTLGNTRVSGTLDVDYDLNVDGGDLTVTGSTFNLANTTATTVNFAGAATAVNVGAATGTTTVKNNLVVDGDVQVKGGDITTDQTTFNLLNTTATTVNLAGAATAVNVGAATGTLTVRNATVVLDGELNTGTSGTTYTNTSLDPTGFDNSHPTTRGVIEYSDNGTRVYSIDKDGVVTEREDSTFATGTAFSVAATAKTLVMFPAPSQASFIYYINGVKYTTTTRKSLTLSAGTDEYRYFYFDGSTLASTATRNDALLISKANVASLYISPSNDRITFIADERHGISIDGDTLAYTIGTDQLQVESGFGLTATAGDEDYTTTLAGVLRNADLRIDVPAKTSHKFATRLGADWKISDFGDDLLSNQLGILDTVAVTAGGSGYQGGTTSAVVSGDGENATVTLGFSAAPIASVTLTNGGFDYAAGTTLAVTGDGTGATASITIPAGKNIATQASGGLVLTTAGMGYTNPVITVVNAAGDTTGTGGVISHTLNLGTPIAHIHVDTLGSGYVQGATTATISGDGTGATATVTVTAGAVTDINITNGGTGYTSATVAIVGAGTGAAATVFTLKNEIVDYLITNVGSGYTSATVAINGDGQHATATATVTAGGVTDIVITNGGHSYTYATMVITGDGTGATAEPRLSGYPIASISFANNTARGKNYTTNPTVTIVENGFGIAKDGGSPNSPATPTPAVITTALSTGNTVGAIALTAAGSGYTGAALQASNIGSGNGGVFTLATQPSSILSATVTDGGRHYSYANIVVTSATGSGATFTTTLTPVPQYNQFVGGATGYDLNNIPASKFTITYFVAISGVDRILKIPSQYLFDSLFEAYIKATPEIQEIREFGLPFNKYEFLGFSIINSLGELVTMPDTNQGSVVYYDLTDPIATNLVEGADGPGGDNIAGRSLTVSALGTNVLYLGATESDKVFYVAPHGEDVPHAGRNLSAPFASVKYACEQSGANATIFVKTGTFTEELPIIVPANTAIVGDNQRTTIIEPAAGFETGTMFKLSNGSILNKMTFKGMTGWVPGATPADITTSTPAGIGVAFNEASPVTTKSPYVLECSFIGVGGIGVYVNGSAHATGNKSMIFHGYTIISDNGVGYWVNNGGLAELVSNFTYYCTFGYTSTNGSKIRSLNGNCSYGLYGATSQGFDATETPITGTLVGQQLNAVYVSGTATVGDTITDTVTGATATILNVQYSADKVYITNKVGTFGTGNNCTTTSGGLFTTAAGAAENVDGFILIVTGLSETPRPGGSISLAGDSIAYVIQSVTGTYVNSSSNMIIVLSQEKPTGSAPGTAITIRYRYSEVRLTGHDFLSIGTGGFTTTNHPGVPTQPAAQGNEVVETFPGRVYYVSTDQSGNFRVGEFFRIDQATGTATLNANAFNLAGLTSLRLGSIGAQLGESINEFSSDGTLAGNSNLAVPTEYSVKTYVDTAIANLATGGLGSAGIALINTVSANTTLAANTMRFSMETLTISGSSVYTINLDAYHFVMNPSGFALLAS
jgi:hypothetical protein